MVVIVGLKKKKISSQSHFFLFSSSYGECWAPPRVFPFFAFSFSFTFPYIWPHPSQARSNGGSFLPYSGCHPRWPLYAQLRIIKLIYKSWGFLVQWDDFKEKRLNNLYARVTVKDRRILCWEIVTSFCVNQGLLCHRHDSAQQHRPCQCQYDSLCQWHTGRVWHKFFLIFFFHVMLAF